jgi:hypothetical protein
MRRRVTASFLGDISWLARISFLCTSIVRRTGLRHANWSKRWNGYKTEYQSSVASLILGSLLVCVMWPNPVVPRRHYRLPAKSTLHVR